MPMYLNRDASKLRQREAQNARNNRAEIVRALSQGQITKRDLFRWGLFTSTGMIAAKHGLSPFVASAVADEIPTGTPASPLFGAQPFTQPLPRLKMPDRIPLEQIPLGDELCAKWGGEYGEAGYPDIKRESYATDFVRKWLENERNTELENKFCNPLTGIGPMEGRPQGPFYAYQRWEEYFPKVGYCLQIGQIEEGIKFHPDMPDQAPNSVWSFNDYHPYRPCGTLAPPLLQVRYGEPVVTRIHNRLPVNRADNGGFGRNEISTHFHNAHNAAESDGANNAYFFPGQFYDYHWSTTLARRDTINVNGNNNKASGPDDNGGLKKVPGDWREIQGTMWFHDHRFFFTAENVYKGNAGMINMYSGPDRGNERLPDGVNLRLPSGWRNPRGWGNIDFDVNLMVGDMAFDPDGQLFFDIFNTDGFLGDLIHVNYAWAPFMEVLPRTYRLRILNCSMSRFFKFVFVDSSGNPVPITTIANDGNFLVRPVNQNQLDIQGPAERFDVLIDFSGLSVGDTVTMINRLEHDDGRGPKGLIGLRRAIGGRADDPAVGPVMQFQVVSAVDSVDEPGAVNDMTNSAYSADVVPNRLTNQIPLVTPVRERVIEWKRDSSGTDSRNTIDGECIPECGDEKDVFPWVVRINGESTHSLNANRISMLIPEPGETEHWILQNGGGGWDHPVHIHFEEAITIDRGGDSIPATERMARKDVWRLRESGQVRIQVTFGEYGGAYVTHCHNTVHEDFAMLIRYDLVNEHNGPKQNPRDRRGRLLPTPHPSPEMIRWLDPEILPEGDPRNATFDPNPQA